MSTLIRRFSAGVLVCLVACSVLIAEEAAAVKPKPGVVTERGLSVTVKPAKDSFAADEAIAFDVTFKNVSEKMFQLFDATYWVFHVNSGGTWACVLKDTASGKEYRPTVVMRPMLERMAAPVRLDPGQSCDTKMELTTALSYLPVGKDGEVQPAPAKPRPILRAVPLPPGTYQLLLALTFIKGAGMMVDEDPDATPFWLGTVKTETEAFQFGAAAAEARGAWQKLFADEAWYKNAAGQERLFTGVLNAVKDDPNMATTLQRTSFYSLDKRTIYTGAKRVDALDKLAGKVVTIRGKAVDMELEGREVREIWPAAVMEAKEPLHPIEVHPIKGPPETVEPPKLPVEPIEIQPIEGRTEVHPPQRPPRGHTLPVEPPAPQGRKVEKPDGGAANCQSPPKLETE